MSMNVEIVEPKIFVGVVADEIVASIIDSVSENGKCSIALSGGSTPAEIYRTLAKPPRVSDIEWSKVSIFWGDERWVPADHDNSNFRMTDETLLTHIQNVKPQIYKVNTTLKDPKDGAKDYEAQIRESQGLSAGEMPAFDIVLLGIGEDGHTASIFPETDLINKNPDSICEAVLHPDGGYRISLTPKAILNAKKVMFIVKGDSKADVMKEVLEGEQSLSKIPAKLYKEMRGKVTFFLDSGAAKKIDKNKYQ